MITLRPSPKTLVLWLVLPLLAVALINQLAAQNPSGAATLPGTPVGRTLFVDSNSTFGIPHGIDNTAIRGVMNRPYATLARALADASTGDTLQIRPGNYALASGTTTISAAVSIVGDPGTKVVPAATSRLVFTAASSIAGIEFDGGHSAGAASLDPSSHFITFAHTGGTVRNVTVKNLVNTVSCIAAIGAVDGFRVENCYFANANTGVWVDSTDTTHCPQNVKLVNCRAYAMTNKGYSIRSTHGYDSNSRGLEMVGCSAANCGGWDAVNGNYQGIGIEVWHFWRGISLTSCNVDNCGYGISIALCYNATLSGCVVHGSGFAVEFASGSGLTWNGCIVDDRMTADSIAPNAAVKGGVAIDTGDSPVVATDININGGSIICTNPNSIALQINIARNVSVRGVQFRCSAGALGVYLQNGTDGIEIEGNDFDLVPGVAGAPTCWLGIETSSSDHGTISFSRNALRGGVTTRGVGIGAAGHAVAALYIIGNRTDGSPGGAGGFFGGVGGTVTTQIIKDNLSPNTNNFVNDNTTTLDTTDYTNTNGANSLLLMDNPNPFGQSSVTSRIHGDVVAKWRTDYAGNVNWIANGGGHFFYTGGDYPGGTLRFTIEGGFVEMPTLPTSSSGLPSGTLWRDAADANRLKVVP